MPRTPRPDIVSGRIASTSTSSEMFHCACTDGDDEVDQAHGTSHQFAPAPAEAFTPLQRSSKSSADVHSMTRRRESDLKEKGAYSTPLLSHTNPPHSAVGNARPV
jgi:hypothetical protein